MQLIQDEEHRHSVLRAQWELCAPKRLFADDKQASAAGARASRTPNVRWEGDASPRPMSGLSMELAAAAAGDRSPVPRRARAAEADGIAATSTDSGAGFEMDSARSPPPIHRTLSPMMSRKTSVAADTPTTTATATTASAGISFPPENDRDLAKYRMQATSASNAAELADAADSKYTTTSAANAAHLNASGVQGRRLAVPPLHERLNALSQITHPAPSSKALHLSGDFSGGMTGGRGFTGPGEFLMERLLRAFAQQESSSSSPFPGVAAKDESNGALAVDALEAVAELLSASKFPRELQEETWGVFARLSKAIPPSSNVAMPVALSTLRPLELRGSALPVPVVSAALSAAKGNLVLIKQRLQDGTSAGGEDGSGGAGVSAAKSNSSLFYDPFAAKRQREKGLARKVEVLWAEGQTGTIVAVLSNPLCVPVFLSAVFPVLQGARHKIFPVAVHIPPNEAHFEVELTVLPEEVGALEIVGLQFIANNCTHVLPVDKTGTATSIPAGLVHRSAAVMLGIFFTSLSIPCVFFA